MSKTTHLLEEFSNLFSTRDFNLKNPSDWKWLTEANKQKSGVSVTQETGLGLPSVLAAVNTYANEMASMPLRVFETIDNDKQITTDHIIHELLNVRPNNYMTPFNYHQMMEGWKWQWGYALAFIKRNEFSGIPTDLIPIHPSKLEDIKLFNEQLYFKIAGVDAMIPWSDMIHLKDLDLEEDSFVGKSRIMRCAEAVGKGIALDKFAASYFGNGANVGLVIRDSVPGRLSEERRLVLQASLATKHKGPDNSHNHIVLPDGFELMNGPTMSNEQSQFIESSKMSVIQVAQIFNLPPNILRSQGNLTYNNAEQELIHYINNSIRPVAKQNEQEYTLKLRSTLEPHIKAKYLLESRLRGDTATQTEHIKAMVDRGIYDIDESRGFLGLNSLPNELGKTRTIPMNMVELGKEKTEENG